MVEEPSLNNFSFWSYIEPKHRDTQSHLFVHLITLVCIEGMMGTMSASLNTVPVIMTSLIMQGGEKKMRKEGAKKLTLQVTWLSTQKIPKHEFQQAPGVGGGQGSLACYSLWGCKESATTEWLIWTECHEHQVEVNYHPCAFYRTSNVYYKQPGEKSDTKMLLNCGRSTFYNQEHRAESKAESLSCWRTVVQSEDFTFLVPQEWLLYPEHKLWSSSSSTLPCSASLHTLPVIKTDRFQLFKELPVKLV